MKCPICRRRLKESYPLGVILDRPTYYTCSNGHAFIKSPLDYKRLFDQNSNRVWLIIPNRGLREITQEYLKQKAEEKKRLDKLFPNGISFKATRVTMPEFNIDEFNRPRCAFNPRRFKIFERNSKLDI